MLVYFGADHALPPHAMFRCKTCEVRDESCECNWQLVAVYLVRRSEVLQENTEGHPLSHRPPFPRPDTTCFCLAFAWIRLVLGSVFIVLGTWSLVSFYRSRWVLDIRTRSVVHAILGFGHPHYSASDCLYLLICVFQRENLMLHPQGHCWPPA